MRDEEAHGQRDQQPAPCLRTAGWVRHAPRKRTVSTAQIWVLAEVEQTLGFREMGLGSK